MSRPAFDRASALWALSRNGFAKLAGPSLAALISRGGQMLLAIVLARTLGVEEYGLFVFAIGAAVLVGLFAGFGWPNVVNRETPRLIREQSWGLLRGLNRAADASTIAIALFLGAGLFLMSSGFPEFAAGLRMAALLALPAALILMRQQQLISVDRPALAMMLDQGMTATIVLLIFLAHPMAIGPTLAVYGLVGIALVVAGTVVVRRRLPRETWSSRAVFRLKDWYSSGAAMLNSTLPRILVTRLDVLMVAPFAGLAEAGLFGSAFRLSLLMTFPQFILQTLITPRFSRAFAAGDLAQVRRIFVFSMAFALVTSFPLLVPALLVPELVMETLFGADFAAGGGEALFWLGIGQFVAAFGVALSTMIAMGGNHGVFGRQGLVNVMATFAVGLIVVPAWGAAGAGMVLAGSNILWVVGMAWLARPILSRRNGA